MRRWWQAEGFFVRHFLNYDKNSAIPVLKDQHAVNAVIIETRKSDWFLALLCVTGPLSRILTFVPFPSGREWAWDTRERGERWWWVMTGESFGPQPTRDVGNETNRFRL